jgi:hypothetical protein
MTNFGIEEYNVKITLHNIPVLVPFLEIVADGRVYRSVRISESEYLVLDKPGFLNPYLVPTFWFCDDIYVVGYSIEPPEPIQQINETRRIDL